MVVQEFSMHNYTTCLFIQTSGAGGRWLANLDIANLTVSAPPYTNPGSALWACQAGTKARLALIHIILLL